MIDSEVCRFFQGTEVVFYDVTWSEVCLSKCQTAKRFLMEIFASFEVLQKNRNAKLDLFGLLG